MKPWHAIAVLFAFDFAAYVMMDAGWVVLPIITASVGGAFAWWCWDEAQF